MMRTLTKHEFIRTRGLIAAVIGIATLTWALGVGMILSGWDALLMFGGMLALFAPMGMIAAMELALAIDYNRSSYGLTGYLTQSLPIRSRTVFAAKLLWTLLVSVVTVALAFAYVYIAWKVTQHASGGIFPDPGTDELVSRLNPGSLVLVVVIFGGMLVSYMAHFLFASSWGNEERLARFGAGGPVVAYVILYVLMQILMVIAIITVPLGFGMDAAGNVGLIGYNFMGDLFSGASPTAVPVGFLPIVIVVALLCVWRTAVSWEKKTNLA